MVVAGLSPAWEQVCAKTCPAFFWVSAEAALGKEGSSALGWWLQCLLLFLEPALLLVHPLFCCLISYSTGL